LLFNLFESYDDERTYKRQKEEEEVLKLRFAAGAVALCTHVIHYDTYSDARLGFSLKFDTSVCEVVLNLHMKCRNRSLWTRPCGAKPRPASPDHLV